jgi:hypothetical protein
MKVSVRAEVAVEDNARDIIQMLHNLEVTAPAINEEYIIDLEIDALINIDYVPVVCAFAGARGFEVGEVSTAQLGTEKRWLRVQLVRYVSECGEDPF